MAFIPSTAAPPPIGPRLAPPALLSAVHAFGEATVPHLRFAWPIRPFHRAHPVRANFGEPRGILGLDLAAKGNSRANDLNGANQVDPSGQRILHTGVDIVAADGTRVYAVASGVARTSGNGYARHVIVGRFGYWHLAGAVASGTRVTAFRTVIGRVYPGQHHVHLTRFYGGQPVNPLLFGGLTPYRDTAAPRLGRMVAYAPDGLRVRLRDLAGPVALTVQGYDRQSLGGLHTGLYRVRYEVDRWRGGAPVLGPMDVVRFNALPAPDIGDYLYTVASTRHALRTRFWYRLTARAPGNDGFLHAERLAPGRYRVVVTAWDERRNAVRRSYGVRVVPTVG